MVGIVSPLQRDPLLTLPQLKKAHSRYVHFVDRDLARLPHLSNIVRWVVVGARLELTALMALLFTPPRP